MIAQTTFTLSDAVDITELRPALASSLLHKADKRRLVSRVKRSVFVLVSPELGSATEYSGNPYLVARRLAGDAPSFISHASAMELRNWLTPYLYLLLWRYRTEYEPVIRPAFYDFPNDRQCYLENDDMMLGPSLLVAAVVELPAPWDRPVLPARAGSVIPMNAISPPTSPGDVRGFLLFPLLEGVTSAQSYEDDGESEAYREDGSGSWRVSVKSEAGALQVSVTRSGRFTGSQNELALILLGSESRPVHTSGALLLVEAVGCTLDAGLDGKTETRGERTHNT